MTVQEVQPVNARGPLVPIIATVTWIVAGIAAAVPVLMSVMMFDSGTDNVPVWVWMAFYGMWLFLLACLVTVPLVWIVWALTRKREGTAGWRVLAALLPVVPLAMVVIGFIGDSVVCSGQLNGC
ncbi:MAG: hypothetical protein F2793_07435 [Actinobacteria bacterium]|uniref:Unannotated protein n=1 Tax=freshwater metagenome TaxID=449393 RepID=A0A6J7EHJ3_9ZZZZ|nr:hypothetical protein [Actinomycetota bacterium]